MVCLEMYAFISFIVPFRDPELPAMQHNRNHGFKEHVKRRIYIIRGTKWDKIEETMTNTKCLASEKASTEKRE